MIKKVVLLYWFYVLCFYVEREINSFQKFYNILLCTIMFCNWDKIVHKTLDSIRQSFNCLIGILNLGNFVVYQMLLVGFVHELIKEGYEKDWN